MSNEDFTDKVEAAIVGVVQFAMRLMRTIVALVVSPGRLLEAVRSGFEQRHYMTPHAFLLSCAIATGLFGKVVADGVTQGGSDIIGQFNNLSLASFLDRSVPVFLIAVASALLAEILLRGQQAERRQVFKQLHFYVIGFFGIGGLVLLLLLSLFLKLTFDQFGAGTDLFIYGSSATLAGYILAMLGILYWLTSRAIRGSDGPALPTSVSVRVLAIDLVTIALCGVNFVSPYHQSGDGAGALEGSIVDLTRQTGALRLTFLLSNTGDGNAVVSRVDKVLLVLQEKQADALTSYDARFCSSRQQGKPESGFLLLAAGKSEVVSICLSSAAMNAQLRQSGIVDIGREQGGDRLVSLASSRHRLRVLVKMSAFTGGRNRIDLPVELCCL